MVSILHDKINVSSATYEVNGGFGKFHPESNYVSFSLFSMNEAKFGVRLDVKVVGFLSVGCAAYEVDGGFGKFNPESNYVSFSLFSMYEMAFFTPRSIVRG